MSNGMRKGLGVLTRNDCNINRRECLFGILDLGGSFPEQDNAQETIVRKSWAERRRDPFSWRESKEALHGGQTFVVVFGMRVSRFPQLAQRTLVWPFTVKHVPGSYSSFLREQVMQWRVVSAVPDVAVL